MSRKDSVEQSILQMQESLKVLLEQHKNESWRQQGNIRIAELCNGEKVITSFAEELIVFFSDYLDCYGGTFYTTQGEGKLHLVWSQGIHTEIPESTDIQQTYLAQAIRKKAPHILEDVASSYFNIRASLLKPENGSVIVIPLFYNENLTGILELAKPGKFSSDEINFLEECRKPVSVYLNTLLAKEKLESLIDKLDSKEQELQHRINAINKATLMVEFDPYGFIQEANDLFLELTKYKREEVVGKHHKIFAADPANYETEYDDFWVNLRKGQYYRGEYPRNAKDGSILWLQASYTPVSDNSGNVYKVIKIGYDISVIKNQKVRIEEISLSLQQQIEVLNKSAIVSETDAEGNILYVNDLFCEISEFSRDELIGKNHRILKSGKQPDGLFTGLWKAIKMGRTWQGEILNKSKNGNYYWVESTITPFINKKGEIEKIVAIRFDITRQKESEALKRQTEALMLVQRELEESNTELEAQSQKLQASEEELRVQQEELMQSNKELDEKRIMLEEKNYAFNLKNQQLTEAGHLLRKKTGELELSSKYKSEFLANMSHELRTPLNSIILLSKLMSDNLEGNLSGDQIEYVSVINKSGNNLLELINEILDLSKIEAGKMDINPEQIHLDKFKKETEGLFVPLSKEKGLEFSIQIEPACPDSIFSDRMRLEQVIKNFLSNAFKFTEKGSVLLRIHSPEPEVISFSVKDSGIGIPAEKQALIFEAFQQADGSTKRKYGGTGLGLSISREIAHLLGGTISLESTPGEGSTFSISIPWQYTENMAIRNIQNPEAPTSEIVPAGALVRETAPVKEVHLDDDRKSIGSSDKTILIVEDDVNLAKAYLMEARSSGFRVLVAMNGNDAVILAKKYLPSGIILDINLPKKNGWDVLKELKEFAETSRIPVHIVSSEDIALSKGTEAGAVSVSTKPVTSESVQKILSSLDSVGTPDSGQLFLFSDKEEHRVAMEDFLGQNGAQVVSLHPEISISEQLRNQEASAIILDISSRKFKFHEILKELQTALAGKSASVIILASSYLSSVDQKRIDAFKDSFKLKVVKSYSGVAEEIRLFFQYIVKAENQKILRPLVNSSRILENRKILVVDDDEQNLFSIRKLLEAQKSKVTEAKNGSEAVELFASDPEIDLILMDVMMPVMDGYEATREIRRMKTGKSIPIITLTAKSNPDEREKCLLNGSSDFITKPLDADQLIGLMKVWLSNASKK